jgi:predicted phage-related endonuclease
MADAEIGRAQGYIVEWKNQVRQSLDTKKLKSEHAEIYEKYLKPAQTVRMFKIKEVL